MHDGGINGLIDKVGLLEWGMKVSQGVITQCWKTLVKFEPGTERHRSLVLSQLCVWSWGLFLRLGFFT